MIRLARFLIPAILLLALAWWVGGLPGTVVAESGPVTVQTSLPAGLLLLFLAALLVAIILRVIGSIRRTPANLARWRRTQRQKQGEAALHHGIAALSVADAATAQTQATRAQKLLGDTPLVLLLTAEAARLAGDHATATTNFEKLTTDKTLGFAGHHGLLRHSLTTADHATAHRHATLAARKFPGSAWVRAQRLHLALAQHHWADALAFTTNPTEITALATAAAQQADPRRAVSLAKTALRAAPAFPPALAAHATALRQLGRDRAARNALRNGWKTAPHPLIASTYLAAFPTPLARAQAAQTFAAINPTHPESALILAETALAADLPGEARRQAEAAITAGLTDARPRAILAALSAQPPPTAPLPGWTCTACHTTSPEWHPLCPHCQKCGQLTWQTPRTALAPGTALAKTA